MGLSRSDLPRCGLKTATLCALADKCPYTDLWLEGMLARSVRCSGGSLARWKRLVKNLKNPGQPFTGSEGERAGPIDLHEKRHSLGRESRAGYACGSHLFVNGIQPLALGTDWRQFANVCAWLGACSSLCPSSAGGLIGKPERVIPDCQSFQAVTWRATFQTISNMNIQGWAYSSSRHWYWLIPHAIFQTLWP